MKGLSIYQIVHTLDGKIYHLEEHLKLLFEGYYEAFNSGTRIDKEAIRTEVEAVIKASRCPNGVSLFIRIEVFWGGEICVTEHERSIYRGYTLRCITPRAAAVEFDLPHINVATSTRESLFAFANLEARRKHGEIAVRQHNGEVDMINGAQIFAVRSNALITAAESFSIEHKIAKDAAKRGDVTLVERPIKVEELTIFDELFYVDHYGVTSIKSCNGRYYMSIVAGAVATLLGKITK